MTETNHLKAIRAEFQKCKEILDKIEVTILGRATDDVAEYEIGTGTSKRALKRISVAELLKLRDYYMGEVKRLAREIDREKNGSGSREILFNFGGPSGNYWTKGWGS